MPRTTAQKLTLLGALYFAQGLPFGFFAQAVPVILRERHWDLDAIGFTALLAAPWAFKFVWAPVLDRRWWPRLGRRRTWILSMQLAGVCVLGAIAIAGGESTPFLLSATFALNLIAATQDIATDGLGVELLDARERGPANGLQVGAYRIGMVVGGGFLLLLADSLGQRGVFGAMALLTALASVPAILADEPPLPPAPPPTAPTARHFLRRPGAWSLLALVFVWKLGESFGTGMSKPFLVDHGFDLYDIGLMIGTVGWSAGFVGAMAGGILTSRIGRRHALVLLGSAQMISIAGYAYLAHGPPSTVELYALCTFETLASGAATAALFTCMMDWSEPASSGTDYSVQASTVVIAQVGGAAVSGVSAQHLGYAHHFELATALCAVAVAAAYYLFPKPHAIARRRS